MSLSKMAYTTPFLLGVDVPTVPIITVPPDDEVLEEVAKGLTFAGKLLEIASVPAAAVPGLPEAFMLMKGGLDLISSIFNFKVEDDRAKAEISVIQNATARVQKCEATIDKQTADLKAILEITTESRIVTALSEEALFKLRDTLNKAYANSLRHFDTISTQLNQLLDNIETMKHEIVKSIDVTVGRIEDEDKRIRTQQLISRLSTVCNYFFAEARSITSLPLEQRVVKLQQRPGIFNFIDSSLNGQDSSGGVLTNFLNYIVQNSLAIPTSVDDYLGFAVLRLFTFGVNMAAYMLLFQMQQHEVLAQSAFEEGDIDKFNSRHLTMRNVFKNSVLRLIADDADNKGFITSTLEILDAALNTDEIESCDMAKPYLNARDGYKKLKQHLISIRDKLVVQSTSNPPQLDVELFFEFSKIQLPANEWHEDSNISYAIQYLGPDSASTSVVSKFSEGKILDTDFANPAVKINGDSKNATRVIYRIIDDGKPKIVAYMYDATLNVFNDVNRDLLDSAYEPNKRLALEGVNRYIEQDINVDVMFEHDRRAIHGAAENDNWEVASQLIKNGSYIDVLTDEGHSPLYIASMNGNYDFASKLLEHGANASLTSTNATQGFTALHVATLKGHANLVKLLSSIESVNVNAPSIEGFTPLHYAATFNQEEAATVLLAHNKIDVDAKSTELQLTPLHLAAIHNSDKVAQLLIDSKKADVSAQAVENSTPLHFAAVYGSKKVVEILLRNGGQQDAKLTDQTIPLHMAAFNGDSDLLAYLLADKAGKDLIDHKNSKHLTPLYLAFQNNNIRAARTLILEKASIEIISDDGGKSLLHLAAEYGHLTAAKNLLSEGISVGNLDDDNLPALNYAVKNNFTEIISELLKHGADPDYIADRKPLIHTLVDKDQDDGLEILKIFAMHKVDINIVDLDTGNSFFQVVCEKGLLSIARYLYENRVDVNHSNKAGQTARDLASANNHFDVVAFLDKIGASKGRAGGDVSEAKEALKNAIKNAIKHTNELLNNDLIRKQREVEQEFHPTHVASAAGRSSGLINRVIESFVSVLKAVPVQLSNLVSLRQDNPNARSSMPQSGFKSFESPDLNSSLLLLDLIIRKNSGQRYVDTTLVQSATPLEARMFALSMVEQMQSALDQLAEQSVQKQVELDWFDLFRTVEGLALSGQYEPIESLMHSTARKALPSEAIDSRLLVEMVERVLNQMTTGQTSETHLAGLHSFSSDNSDKIEPQVRPQLDDISKHYLN